MVQKYNFSEIGAASDPMSGILIFLNSSDHLIFYASLLIIMVVSMYVFLRKTQDIGKSILMSIHITVMISIVIFYWGLTVNAIFLPELFMLTLVVIEILTIAGTYYIRNKGL